MKEYRGYYDEALGETYASVTIDGHSRSLPLRLDLCNHSPTGFAWGYWGSGPAQLALAILADHFPDTSIALNYYQKFKEEVVSSWPKNQAWKITEPQINQWYSLVLQREAE